MHRILQELSNIKVTKAPAVHQMTTDHKILYFYFKHLFSQDKEIITTIPHIAYETAVNEPSIYTFILNMKKRGAINLRGKKLLTITYTGL